MRRAMSERGGRLLVAVSDYQAGQDRRLAEGLLGAGAQGLLLTPAQEVEWSENLGVPTALVERRGRGVMNGPTGLSWVRTDHENGAGLAVRHLYELGHQRIAVFARGDTPTSRAVLRGWDAAVTELGLTEGLRMVGRDVAGWPAWDARQIDTLTERLRDAGATAMLVHSDGDALALLQNGFTSRFAVPRDLSLVAYDDEFAALTSPALTAVSPPKESVGYLAVQTVLELIRDPSAPARHVDVEPRLITRESTASPRA
jgi:DNA-binding LacI/PurR family transcriptional regulator